MNALPSLERTTPLDVLEKKKNILLKLETFVALSSNVHRVALPFRGNAVCVRWKGVSWRWKLSRLSGIEEQGSCFLVR